MWIRLLRVGGHSTGVRELIGCQYQMKSCDAADRSDLDPAYGLHLHDPRFLEYVGAPESARLLSRTPDYWLHHIGPRPGYLGSSSVAARRWPHHVKFAGVGTVCDLTEPDVIRSLAVGVRP